MHEAPTLPTTTRPILTIRAIDTHTTATGERLNLTSALNALHQWLTPVRRGA
jgi:hypothetical protein